MDENGVRYAVPEGFARTIAGEFTRTNSTLQKWLGRPTDVWRAIVLNLRVGWLVNNMVGNHMLLALQHAGPDGARAYLNMLSTTKPAGWVRKWVGRSEIKNTLTDAEWRELFPELPGGTFIGTQTPGGFGGRVSRVLQPFGKGLAPADRAVDYAIRRVAGEAALRKEWKQRLPSDTRKFKEWAKEEVAADPKLARKVVDEVHDTLGNFLSLGPVERGTVRRLIPFYAWYKAITAVTLKLPLNHPARALIVAQLGQIGDEWSQEGGPLPSYLRGAIPLGGDKILKTQGANPWATVPQVGAGAASLFTGKRAGARQLLGEFNPIVALPTAALVETAKGREGKTVLDAYYELLRGLPPVRVAVGPQYPSTLYKDQGTLAELLSFLGVGIRELNRREAAKRVKRGD